MAAPAPGRRIRPDAKAVPHFLRVVIHAGPSALLKGQSFLQRMDEIKGDEDAELSRERGEEFRERKREKKRAAIDAVRQQRFARQERQLMMSFFDSPSQFEGPVQAAEAVAE